METNKETAINNLCDVWIKYLNIIEIYHAKNDPVLIDLNNNKCEIEKSRQYNKIYK